MRRDAFSLLPVVFIAGISLSFFQNCDGFKKLDQDERTPASNEFESVQTSSSQSAIAISLFRRLAGVTPDEDDPQLAEMENHLAVGDFESAAAVATDTPEFYNITVKDFATKMSNLEQSVDTPLNDFVATVIGSVRDGIPAYEMLTENYYYHARGSTNNANDLVDDIITSNRHYQQLDQMDVELHEVLEREEGQKILNPGGNVEVLDDSGGLMTTRGWMAAHAQAGTNRRLVEYAFKIFLCSPIETWASTSNPDNRIGPDVARLPADEYLNKCKSCHSGMDALRPATAHFDFSDNFIKYRYTYNMDPDPEDPDTLNVPVPSDERLVPSKFRRASGNFAGGYRVRNDEWLNYASSSRFGWRSRTEGRGMKQFAQLVAQSEQFSRCMVRRVFQSVCRRSPDDNEANMIQNLAVDFEQNNYQLKDLFVKVATQPQCIGLNL